jgi:hypothetical protein
VGKRNPESETARKIRIDAHVVQVLNLHLPDTVVHARVEQKNGR